MAGSVFFTVIVLGGAVLAFAGVPFVGIPLILIGLALLFAVPLAKKAKDTSIAQADGGPAGTTTTKDASYDPVR
jgi:hypothetical protein